MKSKKSLKKIQKGKNEEDYEKMFKTELDNFGKKDKSIEVNPVDVQTHLYQVETKSNQTNSQPKTTPFSAVVAPAEREKEKTPAVKSTERVDEPVQRVEKPVQRVEESVQQSNHEVEHSTTETNTQQNPPAQTVSAPMKTATKNTDDSDEEDDEDYDEEDFDEDEDDDVEASQNVEE